MTFRLGLEGLLEFVRGGNHTPATEAHKIFILVSYSLIVTNTLV